MKNIITLGMLIGAFVFSNVNRQETDSPELAFIKNHNQLAAEHFGGKLIELDIQKLNHKTSLVPTREVWRSTAKLDVDGAQKEVAIMYIDFVPNDDRVLPIFTMEDGEKIEIPNGSVKDFLAKRAAHFLTYEAKLFNEPDGVNDNGLNIRSFMLGNGESFRGHLISRDGDRVVIETLPVHVEFQLKDFSEADQKWLESAPTKVVR